MSTEIKKEIQLEIAHVLFTDIVGYSKLLIDEQHALLETLNQIVRGTQQFRNAEAAGKLIKIPTGDGMALVFQDRLEAPVECALEISRALKEHPTLPLRMGVHSGPVSGVIDVNGRANVAGAGIIMAQRVMDCGDAGHILLSKHVAEDLEQYARWKPLLHDLGECEVKHGARVQVVNLHTDDLGNPEPPEKFRHQRGKKRIGTAISGSTAARPNRKLIVAAGLIVGGQAVCFGYCLFEMRDVDVVIAATSSAEALLTCADVENLMKARRNRPLLLIDLSVPRNIDPAVARLDHVSLYNIDDLEALARLGVQARERELTACHQIIEAHVAALTEKLHTEEAQSPWRSAPRQLSTTVLIPQPT